MKKTFISILTLLGFFISTKTALAVCPVCTIAVGFGLGISRVLGIDDTISGLWIGGIIVSSGLWTADFVKKRKWKLPYPELTSTLLFLILVVPPLYFMKIIGLQNNTIFSIDKILFGTILGLGIFIGAVFTDKYLRSLNDGKVFIYYQKVLIPVFLLTITSFILYLAV